MVNNFTLSDVIKVNGDGNCFFHALKVGLDNIFSQYAEADELINNITVETLREDIVDVLLTKIEVPIEEFKKITIPIPGVNNEVWTLASYHGVDIGAGDEVYKMAQDQLITHLNDMKEDGIFATDLEVFGAQLYFQELMERVKGIEGLKELGEIKIGIYTPPRTNENVSKGILEGNEGDRGENDAVIRIINVSGYTVNGWHFDALPSTDFNGNLISKKIEIESSDEQGYQTSDNLFEIHFEILKNEMKKIKDEIEDNKQNNTLIDQLTKNKEILIDELINLHLSASGIKSDGKNITDEIKTYLDEQLNNSAKPQDITRPRDINVGSIKAGIGLKLELPLSAKLGINTHCCGKKKGGGMKKKHKQKTAKKTKGKKEKKVRKWSKKYKNSINCKKPKGFSQRQHCLAKSKKSKTTKKN